MKNSTLAGQQQRRFSFIVWLALLLPAFCTVAFAKDVAPDWVNEIAAKPATLEYKKAPIAILLDELIIEIDDDGTFTYRARYVIRVLNSDGRAEAKASLYYNTDSSRVASFRAWLIRPKGVVIIYDKNKITDSATHGTARELYGEGRKQLISATLDADEGSVFAYESTVVERSITSQTLWHFADIFPVECSRLIVRPAKGWKTDARTFNHEPVQPVVEGNTTTWELRQLPAARRESFAPTSNAVRPILALNFHPPATTKAICRKPLFTWSAISAYFSPLYDQAAAPSAELKAKADSLTAGSKDLAERIGRICQYVQATNYISIQLNSAEGGGMIPQPAAKVFRCNYGDCKDKATLLLAMLRTQGIESFPLIVYSGDYRGLQPDWPSTRQFNHCILAIKVDESINGPALIIHPKHGRLIIFDPTHPFIPLGTLPKSDSGGNGLLLTGNDGDLIALPPIQPSVRDNTITARLLADGSAEATINAHLRGPIAEEARTDFKRLSNTDFERQIKTQVQKMLPISEVTAIEPADDFQQAAFVLKMNISVHGYGKVMRDELLVFKPVFLPGNTPLPVIHGKRLLPIVVDPLDRTDTIQFILPAGFVIDELPASVNLTCSVGSYTSALKKDTDGKLSMVRRLQLQAATVAPSGYNEICKFAENILEAEQAPVVLRRK